MAVSNGHQALSFECLISSPVPQRSRAFFMESPLPVDLDEQSANGVAQLVVLWALMCDFQGPQVVTQTGTPL